MDSLFNQNNGIERPDTIVHLGAGACHELEAYLALNPRQIFLVEPNPDQLEVLRQKAGSTEDIQIIESAVSANDSDNLLTILSYSRLSSLREPTRLFELMPGLRIERQIQVATQSINDLAEALALDSSKCNWLVIETPGIEGELIQCLRDSEKLSEFSHLFLRSSCEPFYDGACPISQTLSELSESDYTIVGGPDESYADHPI